MQPHPSAVRLGNLAQRLDQLQHPGLDRFAIPKTGAVFDIHAVSRGVLADDQQFLDAAGKQRAGFIEHVADRPRHQIAAHGRDDAKRAAVITPFADFQISVMPGRQLDASDAKGIGHQVDKRVVRLGQVQVNRVHHLLRGMRAGDGEHAGVHLAHQVAAALARLGAQAAGDDDLAVFSQRFADGVQAFAHGVVNEAAGVDDDQIGAFKGFGGLVALGAELRQDQLRIGQCLGTAQTDKTHARRRFCRRNGGNRGRGKNFTHKPYCLRAGRVRRKKAF